MFHGHPVAMMVALVLMHRSTSATTSALIRTHSSRFCARLSTPPTLVFNAVHYTRKAATKHGSSPSGLANSATRAAFRREDIEPKHGYRIFSRFKNTPFLQPL
jgi:hypothetical protein